MLEKKYIPYFLFFLLLAFFCMLSGCGKKGPPTLKSYEKPPQPFGLHAGHRDSEIILSWDFPKDKEAFIKDFVIFKSSGGDFEKIASLQNDARTYRDTAFRTGIAYKYKVVSQNLRGILSIDSNIVEIEPEVLPSPPSDISFKIEYDSITLNWKSAGDNIYYNIFRSYKQGIYSLTPVNKEPVQKTSFIDIFDISKPVYYTIRSVTGNDPRNEGTESAEIAIDPSQFIPSAPENLDAVVTESAIHLIWKEPPETWVTGYRVYREMNKGEGCKFLGETKTPVFVDKENPSVERSYRVTAIGPVKEGPPAEIKSISFVRTE